MYVNPAANKVAELTRIRSTTFKLKEQRRIHRPISTTVKLRHSRVSLLVLVNNLYESYDSLYKILKKVTSGKGLPCPSPAALPRTGTPRDFASKNGAQLLFSFSLGIPAGLSLCSCSEQLTAQRSNPIRIFCLPTTPTWHTG